LSCSPHTCDTCIGWLTGLLSFSLSAYATHRGCIEGGILQKLHTLLTSDTAHALFRVRNPASLPEVVLPPNLTSSQALPLSIHQPTSNLFFPVTKLLPIPPSSSAGTAKSSRLTASDLNILHKAHLCLECLNTQLHRFVRHASPSNDSFRFRHFTRHHTPKI